MKTEETTFLLSILIAVITPLSHVSSASGSTHETSRRPLKTGDIFTPAELLPVAQKLLGKVEEPGRGKGIVSASKNTEDLADKLFESFFLTSKRFVTLQEFDIAGLDALQALALSGEDANNPHADSITEPTTVKKMYHREQIVNESNRRKSKYKLLSKKVDNSINVKRRGIDLAKKLSKKRRLVVKSRKDLRESKTKVSSTEETTDKSKHTTKESLCRWRYECSNPADLDTCQLHTQCVVTNETWTTADYIGPKEKDPEYRNVLKSFRKMVGLSIIDEEVEKILENRIMHLKPTNIDQNDRVESLAEYFNKIILAQASVETTTATNNYEPAQSDGSKDYLRGNRN